MGVNLQNFVLIQALRLDNPLLIQINLIFPIKKTVSQTYVQLTVIHSVLRAGIEPALL
ncbi:MAG: hypothetical protein JWQ66_52 [Mucilaginibacter sp.]|nr:hypothetical protein [Mucilaginibacter sp.]